VKREPRKKEKEGTHVDVKVRHMGGHGHQPTHSAIDPYSETPHN
jgi:hypothetical protein